MSDDLSHLIPFPLPASLEESLAAKFPSRVGFALLSRDEQLVAKAKAAFTALCALLEAPADFMDREGRASLLCITSSYLESKNLCQRAGDDLVKRTRDLKAREEERVKLEGWEDELREFEARLVEREKSPEEGDYRRWLTTRGTTR
jgi:hypothetical protein